MSGIIEKAKELLHHGHGDTKPTFYTFDGSVWAEAPRLAIEELGWDLNKDFNVHTVVLVEGKNFEKEFLKVSPKGTVPVLKDLDGTIYPDTTSVVKYIFANAPNPPPTVNAEELAAQTAAFHDDKIDPNDLFFHSRNEAERVEKSKSVPKVFYAGRQKALEHLAKTAHGPTAQFIKDKLAYNTKFYDFYEGKASEEVKAAHFSEAASLWLHTKQFVNGDFAEYLKLKEGPFINGTTPGEIDYHAIAWTARAVSATGGWKGFDEAVGGAPASVKVFYDTWSARPSFKKLDIQ